MKVAPFPENEAVRLQALRNFSVLDTPPEPVFDDITSIAAQICGSPIALVSLIDAERQWFKSHRGLDAVETPRDFAFCAHAILRPQDVMVVPDAHQDDRFADNPLVTGEPHIRFYAGAPLVTPTGEALGTLCVVDREPGDLDSGKIDSLRALSRLVMVHLELRQTEIDVLRTELDRARSRIEELEANLARQNKDQGAQIAESSFREAVIEYAAEGVFVCHSIPEFPFLRFSVWNHRMIELTGYEIDEINSRGWYQSMYPEPELQRKAVERMERMRIGDDLHQERWEITRRDGSRRAVRISTSLMNAADGRSHVLALMYDCTEEDAPQQ